MGCTDRAVRVGAPFFVPNGPQVGHVTITNTDITDYQDVGIIARSAGSTIIISRNNIVAPVAPAGVLVGVFVAPGAKGIIVHNKVSGNICNNPICGPDFFNQAQAAGIFALEAAAGTIISNNDVSNNDIGLL